VKKLRKMAKKLESESKISDAMDRVMSGSSLDATDVALILERGVDLSGLYLIPGPNPRTRTRRTHLERRSGGVFPLRGEVPERPVCAMIGEDSDVSLICAIPDPETITDERTDLQRPLGSFRFQAR
jgi:hypothetical protein